MGVLVAGPHQYRSFAVETVKVIIVVIIIIIIIAIINVMHVMDSKKLFFFL